MVRMNKARKEDVIYFNEDYTASIKKVNGKLVKIQDQYFEKEDVVTTIQQAIIKGQLENAIRTIDEKGVKYIFHFSEYDKRIEQDKKSVVKIIVPRKNYDKEDPSLITLNSITKMHLDMKKKNRKKLATIAAVALILAVPKLGQINQDSEKETKGAIYKEIELQNNQVNQLTGTSIDDLLVDYERKKTIDTMPDQTERVEPSSDTYIK